MARRSPEELREVIRDFRRDQIVDVARRLVAERGSVDVPIDEIALEAGVARSTVYVYFANREDLLRACLERLYDLARTSIAAAWNEDPSPTGRLRAVFRALLERVDEEPAFFRLMVATQAAGPTGAAAAVDAELTLIGVEVGGFFESLVADGVAEGRFRPLAPATGSLLIGQQLWGALAVRAADPEPPPLDPTVDAVVEFVLRGLAA